MFNYFHDVTRAIHNYNRVDGELTASNLNHQAQHDVKKLYMTLSINPINQTTFV